MREKHYVVKIEPGYIECKVPQGTITRMDIADLEKVIIFTNDTGPWGSDFWWVLEGGGKRLALPQGATGEEFLIPFLQALPEFDNENFLRATTCTQDAAFLCWVVASDND